MSQISAELVLKKRSVSQRYRRLYTNGGQPKHI